MPPAALPAALARGVKNAISSAVEEAEEIEEQPIVQPPPTMQPAAAEGATTSLMALKGRRITLDEILSSLDTAIHHTAPDSRRQIGFNDADTEADGPKGVGTSRRSAASAATKEGSHTSARSGKSIKMRTNAAIRETARRAAAVTNERGSIREEGGRAARIAAAQEAVSRAAERARQFARENRSTSPGGSSHRSTSPSTSERHFLGGVGTPRSEVSGHGSHHGSHHGSLTRSLMNTPRTSLSSRSINTQRSSLRTPRSINLITSPRQPPRPVHGRIRPGPARPQRSWLTEEQRAFMNASSSSSSRPTGASFGDSRGRPQMRI